MHAADAARRCGNGGSTGQRDLALPTEIFDPNLAAPRHGRVVGAQRAEAMPDEHAHVARPAHAARAFGEVPAALSKCTALAKTRTRMRRRARTSLARDGGQGTLVLFGTGSAGASHSWCT